MNAGVAKQRGRGSSELEGGDTDDDDDSNGGIIENDSRLGVSNPDVVVVVG